MASRNKLVGGWGEELALRYLKKKGYKPVSAGYRTRFGKIDLIVKDRNYIVFTEVKLRRDDRFAQAREFVNTAKQRRLRLTAELWLQANETPLQPRFDVIEIYAPDGEKTAAPVINHIENAF